MKDMIVGLVAFIVIYLRFVVWPTRDDRLCKDCKWFRPDAFYTCHNPKLGVRRDTGETKAEFANLMRHRAWNAGRVWIFGGCGASGAWWEPISKPEPVAPKKDLSEALSATLYVHPSSRKTGQP